MNNKVRLALIASGGFLFLIDRLLKYFSTAVYARPALPSELFGWFPSTNHGIAFSIPIPVALTIAFSVFFIIALLWLYRREDNALSRVFILFILMGAASNIFDRAIYGHTLDYFLLLTAIINIADVMIVGGVAGYLFLHTRIKK
jgi:lipoprotein signal peptidase